MRKILSLLLIAVLLIVPTSTFATEESASTYNLGEALVFDADFSAFEEDNCVITDKANNIAISGSYTKAVPHAVKFGDNTVKYLEFKGGVEEDRVNFATFRAQDSKILGLNDMTVEIWANPNVTADDVADNKNRVLFSVSKAAITNSSFNATFSDSKLIVTVKDNDSEQSLECDVSEYMNKWSQFTFTRSFNATDKTVTVKAYINSKPVIEATVADLEKQDESDKYFYIGAYGTLAKTQFQTMYIGGISEARIYSKTLSSSEVGLNYLKQAQSYTDTTGGEENPDEPGNIDNGILFNLNVGESIAELSDVSGNNIVISSTGNVTIGKYSGVKGNVNYVKTGSKSELQNIYFSDSKLVGNNELTLEFYMKSPDFNEDFGEISIFKLVKSLNNTNNTPLMFKLNDNGSAAVGMNRDGDYTEFFQANNFKEKVLSGGDWVHIVLTRIFEEATHKISSKLYVNGELAGSGEISNVYTLTDTKDHKYYFGDNNYVGGFSEIRVYNNVISDSDIKNKYKENIEKYTAKSSEEVFELNGKSDISREDFALNFKINSSESVDDIKITDLLTGKEISSNINYISDGFEVGLNQYLKYGQQIKIFSPLLNKYTVKTVLNGNSEATVNMYNSNNVKINALDGSDSYVVTIEVKNSGLTPMNYKYSVIAKDDNNDNLSFDGGALSGNSAFVSLSNVKKATKISVYVWEVVNGKLIPLYGMPMVIK